MEDNRFWKTMKTPLGFGTALAVSAGLGVGLLLLRRRLSSPQPEYKKLVERVKEKIREQGANQSYSQVLINTIFGAVSPKAKKQCKALNKKYHLKRLKVLYNPVQYKTLVFKHRKELCNLIEEDLKATFGRIDPISILLFNLTQPGYSALWESVLLEGFSANLRELITLEYKRKLTVELYKEGYDYEFSIMNESRSYPILQKMKTDSLIAVWFSDHSSAKFGVDLISPEAQEIAGELVKTDPAYVVKLGVVARFFGNLQAK